MASRIFKKIGLSGAVMSPPNPEKLQLEPISLETIVSILTTEGTVSRNGVTLEMTRYGDDPDWVYHLARDIDEKRGSLLLDLYRPNDPISPYRLYRAVGDPHTKERTNRPSLPFPAYFALIELIAQKPDQYHGEEGYVQLAKDIKTKTGCAANLAHIWTGARNHRQTLQWPGQISLPLEVFEAIDDILTKTPDQYHGEEGYVQLAKDIKTKTGCAANLATIWTGARNHRQTLQWPRKLTLPLERYLNGPVEGYAPDVLSSQSLPSGDSPGRSSSAASS